MRDITEEFIKNTAPDSVQDIDRIIRGMQKINHKCSSCMDSGFLIMPEPYSKDISVSVKLCPCGVDL